MSISNSLGSATNTYRYSADGRKLQVRKQQGFDITTTDYIGTRLYENGSLKRFLIDGGYIEGGAYYFYLTDHLGSTRVVAKADGTIMQTNHYYPYGLTFAEGIEDSNQRYKFNGKEFDTDLGLNYYDFGARLQDPVLGGRFGTRDPFSRKYYSISPYAYCAGNPVKRIDPTGKIWVDKEGRPMWAKGKFTEYASPEFMRVGNTVMATPTGKKAFNRIARGPGKTGFEVSSDIKYGENGNLIRGEHALDVVYNVNGNYEIGISKVTIYKGSIEAEVNGTVKSEGETAGLIETLPAKDAVDGATASVLVHESGHGTSENLKQNEANARAKTQGLPQPYDLEKAPEAEQNQFLQELLFLLRGY